MFSYLRKELLPKLILAVFFLGDILFFTFNAFDLILLYGTPIFIFSLFRESEPFKKQLIFDLSLNIILGLPISLITGILAASVASDAETVVPFDYTNFISVFAGFYIQLLIIGFVTLCLGNIQRNGLVKTKAVKDVRRSTIERYIMDNVKQGSHLYTDDFRSYARIGRLYSHDTIKHANSEYVRNKIIHTNSIESFWAIFKRGYYGTYHYMSKKHLQRYLDEFTYRFNNRVSDFDEIFNETVRQVTLNPKLTYKMLTYE